MMQKENRDKANNNNSTLDLLEDVASHALEHVHDVLLLDEAHLAIDLSELGLAISAELLVTEALDDLEVLIEASDHQELLEELGGLREGVEGAGVHARRDDEVTGTLGSRLDEEWGLNLDEPLTTEVRADELGDAEKRQLEQVSGKEEE